MGRISQNKAVVLIALTLVGLTVVPFLLWKLYGKEIIHELGLPADPAFFELSNILVPVILLALTFGSIIVIGAYSVGSARKFVCDVWNAIFHPNPKLPQKKLREMRQNCYVAFFIFCPLSLAFMALFATMGHELYQHHEDGVRTTATVQGKEGNKVRYQFSDASGKAASGTYVPEGKHYKHYPAPGSKLEISYLRSNPEENTCFKRVDLSGYRGINQLVTGIFFLCLCLFTLLFAVMALRKARECGRILAALPPEEDEP